MAEGTDRSGKRRVLRAARDIGGSHSMKYETKAEAAARIERELAGYGSRPVNNISGETMVFTPVGDTQVFDPVELPEEIITNESQIRAEKLEREITEELKQRKRERTAKAILTVSIAIIAIIAGILIGIKIFG